MSGQYALKVIRYHEKWLERWDHFIEHDAINGTFLQSRRFLNYHPPERFHDASVLVVDEGNNIYAVLPACELKEDGKLCLHSHKGSTFAGPIINRTYYESGVLFEVLKALDTYFRECVYSKVVIKITPSIFCEREPELLEYLLSLLGYQQYTELNTMIEYSRYNEDILSNFNYNKRKIIRRTGHDFAFKELLADEQCADFYGLLCANLKKYDAAPIHTLPELLDFKNNRLQDEVKFYGIFAQNRQLAGGMLFEFPKLRVAHAQNLSTDPDDISNNAITHLYYQVISKYKNQGYKFLSWGISTEEMGKTLNFSLIKNKENYGSGYYLNRTFYKLF